MTLDDLLDEMRAAYAAGYAWGMGHPRAPKGDACRSRRYLAAFAQGLRAARLEQDITS